MNILKPSKPSVEPTSFVQKGSCGNYPQKKDIRTGLKIQVTNNTRCSGGTPEIGKWYDVTDVNQAPKFRRREGIDMNVYFISLEDGTRVGVHGQHCITNGEAFYGNTKEAFDKFRREREIKKVVDEEDALS